MTRGQPLPFVSVVAGVSAGLGAAVGVVVAAGCEDSLRGQPLPTLGLGPRGPLPVSETLGRRRKTGADSELCGCDVELEVGVASLTVSASEEVFPSEGGRY